MQDLNNLYQLNEGDNGVYFIGDNDTGIIYASKLSLPEIKAKSKGLGVLPAIILPLLSAVSAIAPGAFSLIGGSKQSDQYAQQANIARINALSEQQKAQAMQQTVLLAGGLAIAGIIAYNILK